MTGAPVMDACDACTRRSWLVARLAGHLERKRAERDVIRDVLGLPDDALIAALGGLLAGPITAEYERVAPDDVRAGWAAAGGHALCRHADRHPAGLHDLSDAPAVLHVRGDLERLRILTASPSVAIVGARKASDEGRQTARSIGRGLSAAGVTVVSGMAFGIDSAAHDGALDAGANTVAVLACGPEIPYPRSRAGLHRTIARHAAVVSELPPGTAPYRWAFPARNRIIAALAGLVVIVEAAERSGSLITADIAMDLGRDVGAVPGSPLSWRCAGTNQLLRDGATVIRDAVDVLDGLATGPAADPPGAGGAAGARAPRRPPPGLPADLAALLDAVERGEGTVDAHAATAAEARAVLGRLTELELLGLIQRRPGGRYAPVAR